MSHMMIEQLNESGIVFLTADSIKLESAEYIESEDWLEEFMSAHCDKKADGHVLLNRLYQLYNPDGRKDCDTLKRCKSRQHLHMQLKSKGYATDPSHKAGVLVKGVVLKEACMTPLDRI